MPSEKTWFWFFMALGVAAIALALDDAMRGLPASAAWMAAVGTFDIWWAWRISRRYHRERRP